jgi:hypothetical protein
LITFNDVYPVPNLFPSITCVRVPGREMGEVAAKLLLSRLGGERPENQSEKVELEARRVVVPESLIVRDFFTVAFAHPAVNGVTMWGYYDGCHWNPGAGLFRHDFSPKPSGEVFTKLIKETWSIDVNGVTDADGQYKTRGFLGAYEVEVTAGELTKTVRIQLACGGGRHRVEIE